MPKYTEEHYKDAAAIIKAHHRRWNKAPVEQHRCLADDFIDVFAEENPDFDEEGFLRACELEVE